MGGSHTGGGGSVQWSYDVKNLKRQSSDRPPNGRHALTGADEGGIEDIESFAISIDLDGQSLEEFKNNLKEERGRVYFKLKIRKTPDQITIDWPDKP